jgi:catechol 2,3-dioxygenase-like lactoylglutathione lyase family enzyme
MPFVLHHIGHAVPDIPPALEFYTKNLGYEVRTPVIHDLTQTAYVQFLRVPGERVYVELVSPDGAESKLSRAVRKGGGLNHLCYSVEDIELATGQLYQSGMMILSSPTPAVAFNGRRVSWLLGESSPLIELVEGAGEL